MSSDFQGIIWLLHDAISNMKRLIFIILYILIQHSKSNAQADTTQWKLEFISVNSLSNDYGPAFFKDGLIFSSDRDPGFGVKFVDSRNGMPFSSLYLVDLISAIQTLNPEIAYQDLDAIRPPDFRAPSSNDSKTIGHSSLPIKPDPLITASKKLTKVKLAARIFQTRYNDGPLVHAARSGDIYITRNNPQKSSAKKASAINNLQIKILKYAGAGHYYLQDFPYNSDDFSIMHPAISLEENFLIFASDAPEGYGGTDLYYCTKTTAGWSKPINMGSTINTKGNEQFPFIDANGHLYFSSDGHPGKGRQDIFLAKLDHNQVWHVENMPFPINSPADDTGFIIAGRTGYLGSNRMGTDDIYRVTLK
jgi:hypothetical protein